MTVIRPDADTLARNQFSVFDRLGREMAISEEDRRRVLLLSADEWSAWVRMRDGGPVPAEPGLPLMLRRLGAASYRLSVVAERARAA